MQYAVCAQCQQEKRELSGMITYLRRKVTSEDLIPMNIPLYSTKMLFAFVAEVQTNIL